MKSAVSGILAILAEIEDLITVEDTETAQEKIAQLRRHKGLNQKEQLILELLYVRTLILQKKISESLTLLNRLIIKIQQHGDERLEASAYLLYVDAYLKSSEYEMAYECLKEAEARLIPIKTSVSTFSNDNDKLLAYFYETYGNYYWKLNDLKGAVANLNTSLSYYQRMNNIEKLKQVANRMGGLQFFLGDYDAALKTFTMVRELAENSNDQIFLARAFNNLGLLYGKMHQLNQSLNCFKKCQKIAEKYKLPNFLASAINNEGLIYMILGDWDLALKKFKHAAKLWKKNSNTQQLGLAFNNIGEIYIEKGKTKQAICYFKKCIRIFRENKNFINMALPYRNLGYLHLELGKYEEAGEYVKKSLELREQIGNDELLADCYNLLGMIYRKSGKLIESIEQHQKTIEVCKKYKNVVLLAAAQYNLAMTYREMGELEKALHYIELSCANYQELGNEPFYADSLEILALLLWQQGKTERAIEYLQKVLSLRKHTLKNVLTYSHTLFNYIRIAVDSQDYKTAEKYLHELEALSKEKNAEDIVKLRYQLAHILLLKNHPREKYKFVALEILYDLIKTVTMENELYIFSLLNLSDLLLFEITTFGEKKALEELKEIIMWLVTAAEKQKSHLLVAEVNLLKAQIALIEGDEHEAFALLDSTLSIAQLKGLKHMEVRVNQQKYKMIRQLQRLKLLKEQNKDTLRQRIKLVNVRDTIYQILTRKRAFKKKNIPNLPVEAAVLSTMIDDGLKLCAFYPFELSTALHQKVISLVAEAVHLDNNRLAKNKLIVWHVHSNIYCASYRFYVRANNQIADSRLQEHGIPVDCHIFLKENHVEKVYANTKVLTAILHTLPLYIQAINDTFYFELEGLDKDGNPLEEPSAAGNAFREAFAQLIEEFGQVIS